MAHFQFSKRAAFHVNLYNNHICTQRSKNTHYYKNTRNPALIFNSGIFYHLRVLSVTAPPGAFCVFVRSFKGMCPHSFLVNLPSIIFLYPGRGGPWPWPWEGGWHPSCTTCAPPCTTPSPVPPTPSSFPASVCRSHSVCFPPKLESLKGQRRLQRGFGLHTLSLGQQAGRVLPPLTLGLLLTCSCNYKEKVGGGISSLLARRLVHLCCLLEGGGGWDAPIKSGGAVPHFLGGGKERG